MLTPFKLYTGAIKSIGQLCPACLLVQATVPFRLGGEAFGQKVEHAA